MTVATPFGQPWIDPLLKIFGFKPGDNVKSLTIRIAVEEAVTVTGERYDLTQTPPRDATELEMLEFTKYLQTTTELKEEK